MPTYSNRSETQWDSDEDLHEVTTIYIGNLPTEVNENMLCVPFGSFGQIHSIQVNAVASYISA